MTMQNLYRIFLPNKAAVHTHDTMKRPSAPTSPFIACTSLCTKTENLLATLFITILFLSCTVIGGASEDFPVFPIIKPNVLFWEDIYSRYTTQQGVLHDQDNLAIVYTIINLVDWNTKGSAQTNKKRIKRARQHYKKILADLASGKNPKSTDEKRVAAMFPRNSPHTLEQAQNNIRLQIGQKDRFLEGIIRSGAYMPAIKKIFTDYKLPTELAYLPHVESSFNPDARSKVGATGLWQFTRSTGRQYMRVDNIIDQRNDPYYATRSAAIFLKENHEALGSWPLALTAYNHGRNGMLRALKKNAGYEQIFKEHESRLFKFASRNFYSEFIAALNVARRLEKDKSIIVDRPEATILVKMEGFARAEDIRSHFRISEEDLTRLNPALLDTVLSGKKFIPKDLYVRLPANDRTRELASTFPSKLYYAHQIRDEEYIVQHGDTAGSIARKFKISVAELIMTNNLNKKAMIRVGQRLKISGKADNKESVRVVILKPGSKNRPD